MTDSLAGVIKLFNEKFFFMVAREPIKVDAEVTVVEKALEGIL
jgi:hypothetical protein